jgi:hypothetical protein
MLVLFISTPAFATYFIEGSLLIDEWHEFQKSQESLNYNVTLVGHYMGYVSGIADAFNEIAFKIPRNTKVNQLCAIVGKYLDNNPSEWNYTAQVLVTKALMKEFPIK